MLMCRTRDYAETFLDLEKVKEKVYGPKSVDAIDGALCPSISELRDGHSQRQRAPPLPHLPDLSKFQVSDCYEESLDENTDI